MIIVAAKLRNIVLQMQICILELQDSTQSMD